MTARELIADLRKCGPQSLPVILHFLADRVYAAQLTGGGRLNDGIDFSAWLRELAEASRVPESPNSLSNMTINQSKFGRSSGAVKMPEQRRWDRTCTKCGHIHEGDGECGVFMGKGGFCDCKAEVTA